MDTQSPNKPQIKSSIENNEPLKSSFFSTMTTDIDNTLWNKYLPYQLLILKAEGDGDNVVYKRTPWFFTLPISPQELSISMPIATTVKANLDGITEIHGGAPFRIINITASTGIINQRVAPDRQGALGRAGQEASGVFGGTFKAVGQGISAVQQGLGLESALNIHDEEMTALDSGDGKKIHQLGTGYAQMRLLERFIESYVAMKQGNGTRQTTDLGEAYDPNRLRLALAVWKTESVFLCSGQQFDIKASASSPNERIFSLSLKAWRKVTVEGGVPSADSPHQFTGRGLAVLSRILNAVRAIRAAIQALAKAIESAITGLTNLVTSIIREITNFIKTVTNLGKTIADITSGRAFQKVFLKQVLREWESTKDAWKDFVDPNTYKFIQESVSPSLSAAGNAGASALNSGTSATSRANAQASGENDGVSNNLNSLAETLLDGGIPDSDLDTILDSVEVGSLQLESRVRALLDQEAARVRAFTRSDFEERRNAIQQHADDYAASVGIVDATFDNVYDRPVVKAVREATDDDYQVLYHLNDLVVLLDELCASAQINPNQATSLEYVAGLAERSGIAFRVPASKFAVPFPYGFTLERLSALYLGDPNRWHEIATLNGLRSPYIDEQGFQLPLLTNGDRNEVTVANVDNLYIGQTVWVSGNGASRTKRHVLEIREVGENYVIALDGSADLQRFTTYASSKLETFLPGTVNSQQVIYIPSEIAVAQDPQTKAIPGVDDFDPLLKVAGQDLLLTLDNDVVITPDGDGRIAYGMQNIVQTIRLALMTPQGSLLDHPEYGMQIKVGSSIADVDAHELLKSAKAMFSNDPSFTGVRSASVRKSSNSVQLTLEVGMAGVDKFIPINVNVVR